MLKSLRVMLALTVLTLTTALLYTPSATVFAQELVPCTEWNTVGACAPALVQPQIAHLQTPASFEICRSLYNHVVGAYYEYCFYTFQTGYEWRDDWGYSEIVFVDPGSFQMSPSFCPNSSRIFYVGPTTDFTWAFTYDELFVQLKLKPYYCQYR